jgi:flavodoxin
MHIFITYSTNSGGTYVAARTIASVFAPKHEVTVKKAAETTVRDILSADIVFFGSPSWDFEGKEGQPHQTMIELLRHVEGNDLTGKQCFIFGCGDSSYTHFCGAVDILEAWTKKHGATVHLPSLRLDEFFFHEKANTEKTKEWAATILKNHFGA